jgi:hypothetical protein
MSQNIIGDILTKNSDNSNRAQCLLVGLSSYKRLSTSIGLAIQANDICGDMIP